MAFDVKSIPGEDVQVVQSLAKWKRFALKKYEFEPGYGLYTDMNAIRRDEDLDNLHSVYVDQWDWEAVIHREDRTVALLIETVRKIYEVILETQKVVCEAFPALEASLPKDIHILTTQELEDRYPELTPKQRENAVCKEYGAVFLMQIGGKLKSGIRHDGRSPDYDDWSMNGDILVWYEPLQIAFELSSMGVRVDERALLETVPRGGLRGSPGTCLSQGAAGGGASLHHRRRNRPVKAVHDVFAKGAYWGSAGVCLASGDAGRVQKEQHSPIMKAGKLA